MIEEILKDEFMDYRKVQDEMKNAGLTKKQIREEKMAHGVETVQINNGEEKGWLWYIPKNVWNRFFVRK